MKKLITLLCIICLTLPVYAAKTYNFMNVKYVRNHDGDTIVFDLGSNIPEPFRYGVVRLYGIDTPEVSTRNANEKKAGKIARDFVTYELNSARTISLEDCSKDKYVRLLCRIDYDGKDLTTELLNKHYGYAYYGDKKNASKVQSIVDGMVGTK